MKVSNMTSSRGNKVPNQFIVNEALVKIDPWGIHRGTMFQSYKSNIAFKCGEEVFLDKTYWDYSVTTGKCRNQFLGENKAETQKKLDSGEYKLVDLNK